MGFFKDFKRDFAQAVNELMPDKDELAEEYDDEDIVNTFDEEDNMEVAPEDVFEDLDDFRIDTMSIETMETASEELPMDIDEPEEEEQPKDILDSIPEAEVISEPELPGEETQNVESVLIAGTQTQMSEEEEQTIVQELSDVSEISEESPVSGVDLNHDVLVAMKMREEQDEIVEQAKQSAEAIEEASMTAEDIKLDVEEQGMEAVSTADTTYITKGTTVTGNIETEGAIDVLGTVIGDVSCAMKLIIGGNITGNVHAGEIYANAAKIEGEVVSEGSVKIGVGSVVVGNVSAASAVIAGAVNGDIDVQGPVIVDSTAVIMGNIKSRSVQINNGAVIEGFCSQCYSEIDVKSFFG
ncbi:MAG: polymer-forming cytoskeletal protein [Lachnospiraceae bacterium]|nr:polymer-forming cytoskeletal protein [Lachnospiraceae bacterium]